MRSYLYQQAWKQAGFAVDYLPFFDDDYIARLYAGKRQGVRVAWYYLRRIGQLLKLRFTAPPDAIIWAEKELLPWLPAWVERLLLPRHLPLVLDYDDAIFHRYDQHKLLLIRKLLGKKLDRLMRHARMTVAGNEYLAQRARKAGCRQVEIVPTVVDLAHYPAPPPKEDSNTVTIGWVGSPSTVHYLHALEDVLQPLHAQGTIRFLAIGAKPEALEGSIWQAIPWDGAREAEQIAQCDIGIMPLTDDLWSRGKCGYKLIQYMACGLPVVASPVGVNAQIVEEGTNGFLATTPEDWQRALTTLTQNATLRKSMGQSGRQKVEDHYSLQLQGPHLVSLLLGILS